MHLNIVMLVVTSLWYARLNRCIHCSVLDLVLEGASFILIINPLYVYVQQGLHCVSICICYHARRYIVHFHMEVDVYWLFQLVNVTLY